MDIEKLKKEWISEKPFPLCSLLKTDHPKTCETPLPFWTALFETTIPSLKAVLFETYPLYDDCITRHIDTNPIALKILEEKKETWTYKELDAQVSKTLPLIESLGPTISLPHTHSLEFLLIFLSAIKLGKTLSFTDTPTKVVLETNSLSQNIPTHIYQAGDPLFTYKGETLDVNTAFLCSLRDSFFHLQLKQGTTYARPLTPVFDDEPTATLAALLAGATLVYTTNAHQISEHEVDVLGVCPALQKKWISSPDCPTRKLKLWYKTPLYGAIYDTPNFILLNNLQKIPYAELLIEPLRGGITLASRPQDPQNILHPNFGIPYSLLQLNGCGEKSIDGVGYFHIEPSRENTLILSTLQEGYWISYSKKPLREGRPYPIEQIEACALKHPDVHTAIVSTTRDPHDIHGSLFTLVLFTLPDTNFFDITPYLSSEYLPDHIAIFPFYPRRLRGTFHRGLTLAEFEQGNFYRKQKLPVYHLLNRFRHSIRETLC